MLTLHQLLVYCSRNNINSIAITETLIGDAYLEFSNIHPSDVTYATPHQCTWYQDIAETYRHCQKHGLLDDLLLSMRLDMRRRCPKRASFAPHNIFQPLFAIDDDLPF